MVRARCALLVAIVVTGIAARYAGAAAVDTELNRLIRAYSTQQIVGLDVDETFTFKLNSGAEGTIVKFWPSRDDLCSILIQDSSGLVWEYGHLSSASPDLALNVHVDRGRKIGMLGRTGPSGNFSHVHLGTYLSLADMDGDKPNRRLNLYPWLVTAYQAQHPKGLLAVARPHQTALTGEEIVFDGRNSLAWGGGRIVEWRWVLPDAQAVSGAKAQKVFDRPGAYVATLWVKDNRGAEDMDFCHVKIFSKGDPEKAMPHVFMTYTPTQDIRPDQPVTFRFWFQGAGGGPIKVDFGDAAVVQDYQSYAGIQHSFKRAGVHIVTAQCETQGRPITNKLKVVVTPRGN